MDYPYKPSKPQKERHDSTDDELIKYVFRYWDLVNGETKNYLKLCGIEKEENVNNEKGKYDKYFNN